MVAGHLLLSITGRLCHIYGAFIADSPSAVAQFSITRPLCHISARSPATFHQWASLANLSRVCGGQSPNSFTTSNYWASLSPFWCVYGDPPHPCQQSCHFPSLSGSIQCINYLLHTEPSCHIYRALSPIGFATFLIHHFSHHVRYSKRGWACDTGPHYDIFGTPRLKKLWGYLKESHSLTRPHTYWIFLPVIYFT